MEGHALAAGHEDKPGFIYGITHPAWPGHVKIGKAGNVRKRLGGYNICCPYRMFEVAFQIPVDQMSHAEAVAHRRLRYCQIPNTEWFQVHPQDALNLLSNLTNGGD